MIAPRTEFPTGSIVSTALPRRLVVCVLFVVLLGSLAAGTGFHRRAHTGPAVMTALVLDGYLVLDRSSFSTVGVRSTA